MYIKRRYPLSRLIKKLKCLIHPFIRLKNIYKKPQSWQFKILIILSTSTLIIFTLLFLLWNHPTLNIFQKTTSTTIIINATTTKKSIRGSPMRHVPLNKIYKNIPDDNDTFGMMNDRRQVNMLDTPGCKIPLAMINYRKYLKINKSDINKCIDPCGQRAIFLNREDGNKIRIYVDSSIMKQYLSHGANYYCCYRSIRDRKPIKDESIKYSVCRNIEHGSVYQLETDFVNVKCFQYDNENVSHTVYDDFYVFTKKITIDKVNDKLCDMKYNVLVIGMNSMSLPRVVQLMPRTIKFFKDNYWLGFRGYHKIGDNTLPNLIALLTGQNFSALNECSKEENKCRASFIWSIFKKEGYVTAFGEDSMPIRNTFKRNTLFSEMEPIDHYLNPRFLTNPMKTNTCSGKSSYGQQLLNYASDFVNTYKKQTFFGVFWMDSHSLDINNCSQNTDKMFENFFFKLSYTGSLMNTFVMFLSDEGIRFGDQRMKVESYYDERMPFLFIWAPTFFRGSHPQKLRYLVTNQFRLVTPYDLFKTLKEIKNIVICQNSTTSISSHSDRIGQSILNVISEYRTCDDAGIHLEWCSCHNLFPLPIQDNDGAKAVAKVISLINSILKSALTGECYSCLKLYLKKVIRVHFYYNKDTVSMIYVVAFTVFPGEMSYEATVAKKEDTMKLIGQISIISPYRNTGRCTLKSRDRMFCICKKTQNCSSF